jgi:hypothetical protein
MGVSILRVMDQRTLALLIYDYSRKQYLTGFLLQLFREEIVKKWILIGGLQMDHHPKETLWISRMPVLIGELAFLLDGNAQKKSRGHDRTDVNPVV